MRTRLIGLLAIVVTFTALTTMGPCAARVAEPPAADTLVLDNLNRDRPTCPSSRRYADVRIAERRVNSIEAMKTTPTCFAEADFMLTADDTLVATHDPAMGGDCGEVGKQTLKGIRRCRLADGLQVATLTTFSRCP